jgi:hypothetical protein
LSHAVPFWKSLRKSRAQVVEVRAFSRRGISRLLIGNTAERMLDQVVCLGVTGNMAKVTIILLLSVLLGCQTLRHTHSPVGYRFVPRSCPSELSTADAVCGYVTVPDDYAYRGGRAIDLNVVIFKAMKRGSERAAQFDLEGGPGSRGSSPVHDGVRCARHRRGARGSRLSPH